AAADGDVLGAGRIAEPGIGTALGLDANNPSGGGGRQGGAHLGGGVIDLHLLFEVLVVAGDAPLKVLLQWLLAAIRVDGGGAEAVPVEVVAGRDQPAHHQFAVHHFRV